MWPALDQVLFSITGGALLFFYKCYRKGNKLWQFEFEVDVYDPLTFLRTDAKGKNHEFPVGC